MAGHATAETEPVAHEAAHEAADEGAHEAARLRWRTRDTTRHLLFAFLGAFAGALVTGTLLWLDLGHAHLTQVLIVAHLAAGALALAFFVPFVVVHWRDGREPLVHLLQPWRLLAACRGNRLARSRLVGHALMWSLALLVASGGAIAVPALLYLSGYPLTLPYGAHAWLLDAHRWLTPLPLVALAAHFPMKERT